MRPGFCLILCTVLTLATTRVPAAEVPENPSFQEDVIPVLTRFGCNMGACHGKLAGQNGFRLSLRGYAPDMDFRSIAREENQRRIDVADPAKSLLLTKPTAKMPHGGGKLFEPGSDAYRLLENWIRAGAPGPKADEPRIAKLTISPAQQTMKVGQSQPLVAAATYSDGRTRDVTWLTKFESNDAGLAAVSPGGVVTAQRHGETAVRAAFQGQVEVAIFTVPLETPIDDAWYAQKNNLVDEHVFAKLKSLRIEPAPLADDAAFVRRVFLDAIGTLPTPDEVRAFLADTDPAKRSKLIDALLERPEYADFWALQLGDLLQNRKERDHDVRGAKQVRQMHAWLRGQVAANRPWHELARDVLTATGPSNDYPQIGYFVVTVGERKAEESEVADSVAQAFMGTRIGCARCHNHPLEKYTQDDYYHFVAFFSRVSMFRKDAKEGGTELQLGDDHARDLQRRIREERKKLEAGENEQATKRIGELEKELEKHLSQPPQVRQPRTGKMMVAQPLDRSALSAAEGGDPRRQLVAWMTRPDNDAFAGAMVNRLWKHFFSVGLVEPVDDLRATNPPSNPELWRAMVSQFKESNYNLKHVMRLVLNSRAYQLSSATRSTNATETRFYSHYYPRRLPAEVLLDAISQSTGVADSFAGHPVGLRAIQLPGPQIESYFLSLFGRSDRVTACACERTGDVTLPQLLHLQNGDGIVNKLGDAQGRLNQLLDREADNNKVIDELFLATASKGPNPDQRAAVEPALAAGDRREVFADLFWALLNAKEFAFNH